MSSAGPFSFSSAAELLGQSGNIPRYAYTSPANRLSESPCDGRSCISGGDFSSQSTVTSLKTENWSNSGADLPTLENCRLQQTDQDTSHRSLDRLALLASVASDSIFCSLPAFTTSMSSYMSGSNTQAEALQTLHLMNPNFTGYGDSPNSGNMGLFSPGTGAVTGHGSPIGSSDLQQHQFVAYNLPSAVTQAPFSHQSRVASISNTELVHQNNSPGFFAKHSSSHGYNWGGGGNEFSLLPSGQVTESNQPLMTQMSIIKPSQLSSSGLLHYDILSVNPASYREQASLFSNNVAAHVGNMENLQAPSGAGHILSLSLTPHQPPMVQQLHCFPMQHKEPTENFLHAVTNTSISHNRNQVMFSSKCTGAGSAGGSFTVPSCDNMLAIGYESQSNTTGNRHVNIVASQFTVGNYACKYLKPAQELLNEVVNVGRGVKGSILKPPKMQLWTGPSSASEISFVKGKNVTDVSSKPVVSWSAGKEEEPIVTAVPLGTSEHPNEAIVELTPADRQELQAKRAKLLGMRDEVDRRYKEYHHQMQVVATSYESAAGLGAATAYTALALQTISKHFRCLRDAITGQIQGICKALGEEEVTGFARGETSKLRFIDQQLRQQRALRQLGMMQQQAWRPQRGLPEHSVSILRAWLFEHFLHPYPKDADKIMLAKQTGLNRNQVSNWFINARVRLWKPMVEEMYLEETKEGDADRADKFGGNGGNHDDEAMVVATNDGTQNGEISKRCKQVKLSNESCEAKGSSNYVSDMNNGRTCGGSPCDNLMFHDKEGTKQGVVKPRDAPQIASTLLSPNSGTVIDFRTHGVDGDCALESESRTRSVEGYKEPYGLLHNSFVQADHMNLAGYGSYQINGLSRFVGQESFGPNYAANGVSLTLGLQHCEGLSFSGAPEQHYGQGAAAHLLTNRREGDGVGSMDYYNGNESGYEVLGLQDQKHFPSHMLCHDFVV